jgi:hypothetical protein
MLLLCDFAPCNKHLKKIVVIEATADAMWHKLKKRTLVSPEKCSGQTNAPSNDQDLSHLDVARSLSWISEKGVCLYS